MLKIFLLSYLAISVHVTNLFLLAFSAAQGADRSLEGTDKYPYQQHGAKKVHSKRSVSSVDF